MIEIAPAGSGQKKYAALISYLGTNYSGWQIQAHATGHDPSIQAVLEAALEKMVGQHSHWQASGRTDAGVHALGQVANFSIDWSAPGRAGKPEITPFHLHRGLNTILPSAIRILELREAPADFHAQLGASKKQYSYYIQTGRAPSALHAGISRFHRRPLNVAAMDEGIRHLLGEHDFLAFQGAGSKPMRSTVRTMFEAEVVEYPTGGPFSVPLASLKMIRIRVVGSGFLKHMVRGIAGTLIQIGNGARPPSDIRKILETKDRSTVGPSAQPQGLWLERVWYPNLDFDAFPELDPSQAP